VWDAVSPGDFRVLGSLRGVSQRVMILVPGLRKSFCGRHVGFDLLEGGA